MTIMLFILLLVLMFLGIPVFVCLMLSGAGYLAISNFAPLSVVAQRTVVGMDSFPLLAITLFMCTGYIMESTTMSKRLVEFVDSYFGHFHGSIGIVTILSCTVFAALTGSGAATVAAIGAVMLPALLNAGYKRPRAAGLLAAGGALGPIIPPSIIMIVYGATMEISVPAMFIGSIVPGLIIAFLLIVTNMIIIKRSGINKGGGVKRTGRERLKATKNALGTLALPVVILGGIYGGLFTPTEAAAVSTVYALIVGFVYKELNAKTLINIAKKTVETASGIILIVGAASVFSWLVAITRVPVIINNAIIATITNKYIYLIALTLVLLVAGALLDALVTVVILAPIIVPPGIALGVDPLHMGILFCVTLIAGLVTPPFGYNLFVASSLTGLPYIDVVKGVIPYMITLIIGALLIVFIPQLSLIFA